jgi:hypothetical protein
MYRGIRVGDEEAAGEPVRRDAPRSLDVVVGRAKVDLDWRHAERPVPRIGLLDDQVAEAEQLDPGPPVALALRGDRAVEIAEPYIQHELGARLLRVGRERVQPRVVEAVRKLRRDVVQIHVATDRASAARPARRWRGRGGRS